MTQRNTLHPSPLPKGEETTWDESQVVVEGDARAPVWVATETEGWGGLD
jgi:hypothetical protein